MLAVQRQGTRPKAGYNSRTPAGAKKKEGRRAERFYGDTQAKGARCSSMVHSGGRVFAVQRRGTRPKAGYNSRTPAGAKKKEKNRRAERLYGDTQAKGARHSSMIHSGEGCSLFSDNALWRRVLAVQRAGYNSRTPAGAKKKEKGQREDLR